MDIHKPKAAHSWREFLVEIGTIICGILIALGLEQAVEAMHRNSEVREAREALHEEIALNLSLVQYALQTDECALGQYEGYIAWAKGGPKPPPVRANLIGFYRGAWETVKSRAVPNMPLQERLALGSFYDTLANTEVSIASLRSGTHELDGLSAYDTLTPANAGRVLELATATRRLTPVHAGLLRIALERGARTGVAAAPTSPLLRAASEWTCTGKGVNPVTGER